MRFTSKVALVTGSNTGIGEGIAKAFAAEGASVIITGRREGEVDRVVDEIRESGGTAAGFAADITTEAGVHQLVDEAHRQFGPINILVNNAGIRGPMGTILELDLKDWEEVVTTNLTSTFLVTKAVVPDMVAANRGWIVTIGSISGKRPMGLRLPYATTKAGLVGFTHTMSHQLALHNINVNLVSPGMVETPAGANVSAASNALREKYLGEVPLDKISALGGRPTPLNGKLIQPSEVAALTLFLCSEDARRMTGQDINITGGVVQH